MNVGDNYGELTIETCAGRDKYGQRRWVCICSCGIKKEIAQGSLKSGATRSCGCLQKKRASESSKTHGASKTVEYKAWARIKDRCYNKKNHAYKDYGGRGIGMALAWQNNFSSFLLDMGEKPSDKHTIERVENSGDYCKENCIWTDDRGLQGYNRRIQSNNKSGKSGVFFHERLKKWEAYIWHVGVKKALGLFIIFEEAVASREAAEIYYYGFNKQ
jgi:hypothetical protein